MVLRLLRRPPDIALDVFVNEICFYRLERIAIEDFLMDEELVANFSSCWVALLFCNQFKGLLLEDQEAIVEKKVSFNQGFTNRHGY